MTANSAPFLVGGVNSSGVVQSRYTGLVDELQVFDSALSAADIDYLHDHPGAALPEPVACALLAISAALLLRRRK